MNKDIENQKVVDHSMEILPGSSWVRTMTPASLLCEIIGKHKVVFPTQDYGQCLRCKSELHYCWTN